MQAAPLVSWKKTPLLPPVTICILFYGNYPALARRILESLHRSTLAAEFRVRLGLNAVSIETAKVIEELASHLPVEKVIVSETNLYKAGMMRRLFYDLSIITDWTIWFDDDSYLRRGDWLGMLSCASSLQPEIDMWGKRLFLRGEEKHRQFIREASWFHGLEPEEDDRSGFCRLHFIAGGFWAIRTSCLHLLNWPDHRLLHFGDDYFLGEAMRQIGAQLGGASSGVVINDSPRRAPADTPRCEVLH